MIFLHHTLRVDLFIKFQSMCIRVTNKLLIVIGMIFATGCSQSANNDAIPNSVEQHTVGVWRVMAQVDSTSSGNTMWTGYSAANNCNFTATGYVDGGVPVIWKQCTGATTGLSEGRIVAPVATGKNKATFWYYDTLMDRLLVDNSENNSSRPRPIVWLRKIVRFPPSILPTSCGRGKVAFKGYCTPVRAKDILRTSHSGSICFRKTSNRSLFLYASKISQNGTAGAALRYFLGRQWH
jgi:hypothetical protein